MVATSRMWLLSTLRIGVAERWNVKVCSLELLHFVLRTYLLVPFKNDFIYFVYVSVGTCVPWSEDDSTGVQVRGQPAGVSSLLPLCGFWDQTQFSSLAPSALPTEPSHQPYNALFL